MWSYRDNFDYTQYYGSNIKVHVKYDNKNNGVQDNSYIDNENSNENSNENNNIKEYITSGILTNITKSDYGCVSVILFVAERREIKEKKKKPTYLSFILIHGCSLIKRRELVYKPKKATAMIEGKVTWD